MKSNFWITALLGFGVAFVLVPLVRSFSAAGATDSSSNTQSGGGNPPGTVGGTGPDSSQPIPGPDGMPPAYFKNTPSGY